MFQVNPFGEDVLREVARIERQTGCAHFVYALLRQKADLAVPVACVRVTDDAVIFSHRDTLYRMLFCPFMFTNTNCFYFCHIILSYLLQYAFLPPLLGEGDRRTPVEGLSRNQPLSQPTADSSPKRGA